MSLSEQDFAAREATFDRDGYPTEETLECIAAVNAWPWDRYDAWIEFCREAYAEGRGWIRETPKTLVFVTGGWSGNESVIRAMEQNLMFVWFWRGSKRGGLHVWDSVEVAMGNIARGKEQEKRRVLGKVSLGGVEIGVAVNPYLPSAKEEALTQGREEAKGDR